MRLLCAPPPGGGEGTTEVHGSQEPPAASQGPGWEADPRISEIPAWHATCPPPPTLGFRSKRSLPGRPGACGGRAAAEGARWRLCEHQGAGPKNRKREERAGKRVPFSLPPPPGSAGWALAPKAPGEGGRVAGHSPDRRTWPPGSHADLPGCGDPPLTHPHPRPRCAPAAPWEPGHRAGAGPLACPFLYWLQTCSSGILPVPDRGMDGRLKRRLGG